jgi:hypothetical protein
MGMTRGVLNPVGGLPPMPEFMKAALAAGGYFKPRPRPPGCIPPDCRFALLRSSNTKPMAFSDLRALARCVHRLRDEAPLQIMNVMVALPHETAGRWVAQIYTLYEGNPSRLLGYAWVGPVQSPRDTLMAGLDALQPRRLGTPL